ncbi:oxidoreductase-like protein [Bisporella sp. PMI_857]|nr:oxidoreductase-like protein [Bisporella sp. PMI_857]
METRFLFRTANRLKRPACFRMLHASPASLHQANPLGDYYTSILEFSSPKISSKPPTTARPSSAPSISFSPAASKNDDSGPKIIFSSRLSSPLERRAEIERRSKIIAGVSVPPRPDEPDNCCMSGCVNCVWDAYRDDLEEWAAANKAAEVAMRKQGGREEIQTRTGVKRTQHTLTSTDDDGGGSEGLWGEAQVGMSDELFGGIPVGIREFMKQEKRLKEKHAREDKAKENSLHE